MKIYFCGSMTHNRDKQPFYEEIINYLAQYGEVVNAFVKDKVVTNYDPEIVFKRDTNNLVIADILIADVSCPSCGVGYEIGYWKHLNKRTLIIYDENLPLPSALILGDASITIKSYNNVLEAKNIITEFVNNK